MGSYHQVFRFLPRLMKNFPSIKICLQEHTNYYPGQLMIMNTTTLPLFFYHIQPTTMPDLSFSIPFQAVIGTSLSAHCLAGNGAFLNLIAPNVN